LFKYKVFTLSYEIADALDINNYDCDDAEPLAEHRSELVGTQSNNEDDDVEIVETNLETIADRPDEQQATNEEHDVEIVETNLETIADRPDETQATNEDDDVEIVETNLVYSADNPPRKWQNFGLNTFFVDMSIELEGNVTK
jgi:hypothetical protein